MHPSRQIYLVAVTGLMQSIWPGFRLLTLRVPLPSFHARLRGSAAAQTDRCWNRCWTRSPVLDPAPTLPGQTEQVVGSWEHRGRVRFHVKEERAAHRDSPRGTESGIDVAALGLMIRQKAAGLQMPSGGRSAVSSIRGGKLERRATATAARTLKRKFKTVHDQTAPQKNKLQLQH